MKRLHLIILLAATVLSGMAQTIGEAFYIYRNDGQFNAFYCEDLLSIEYSYEDAEGNTYDEIVTQIVNTVDGVYKIPLAVIDSVAFRVNEITVSLDYLPIDENSYSIISADVENGQYVLQFTGSVPEIETGRVLTIIGDGVAEVVRVFSVQRFGQQVSISAEAASLGDIFTGGSFTLSTEPEIITRASSLSPVVNRVFRPVEIAYYDENNQRHYLRRNAFDGIDFEHNLYNYAIDYSGHEFYKNDYMKFYLEICRFDFSLDLVISCNFNSFGEGLDRMHKGELVMQKSVIRGKVDTDLMLRFDASGKKQENLEESMLKMNLHKPIIAKFIVAGVPVVVVMNTHLLSDGNYGVEGNFTAYAGFATSTSAELGCSWSQATGIKPYASFDNTYTLHDPTIEGSAHLEEKVSVFPRITFSLYGLLGPSFDIKPYMRQSLDIGFYDDLIASTPNDFYGAEYNLYAGYDAAVGLSYFSVAGNEPFVKSPSWNVAEAYLYKAPQSIQFQSASSETAVAGRPIEVSFMVKDLLPAFNMEVSSSFPLVVKFETNSGVLSSDFSNVNVVTGLSTITWTPASQSTDNADPYLLAMMHDHTGRVIASDRWTPKKSELPVKITDFKQTGSKYQKDGFTYNGKSYSYKYDCAVTVELASGEGVEDWGYVYQDPQGNPPARISLKTFNSPYTDKRYSYYRNESSSTVTLYEYVKYAGDSKYYYGEAKDYKVSHKGETTCPDSNHPHMIDLGLPSGTKWACCNVGASAPEDYGNYYAWGETQPKSVYNWDTYQYGYYNGDGDYSHLVNIGSDIAGTRYDAATANWGAPWRMPTMVQCQELYNNATSVWTTQNGVNGRKFTGPNGGTIFLPAAGERWDDELGSAGSNGLYRSSSLGDPSGAYVLGFHSSGKYWYFDYRCFGRSVRPVR